MKTGDFYHNFMTVHNTRKWTKKRKIFFCSFFILIFALLVCIFVFQMHIVITPEDGMEVHAELGEPYQDSGAEGELTGTLFRFIHKPVQVSTEGEVDTNKAGTYEIIYSAKSGRYTVTCTKKVIVSDTRGPVITLKSNPDSYTPYGHPYEEEGFTAIDATDGDVTDKVTSEESDGKVYYRVSDSLGSSSEAIRTIHYDDRKGPDINLAGGNEITWYTDQGDYVDQVTAVDDVDGDVTSSLQKEGSVDASVPGDYTLSYSVTDAHGNTTTAQRIVHVLSSENYNARTIYLTFDDGPGPYTDQLLDILDQYNVKATFFTTSVRSQYSDCIKKEAERGHSVYVHSASHNYAKIYASPDAYWADFDAQNSLIQQETGSRVNVFRFPGGSSNTVSANYSAGIMTTLTQQASARGLIYEDWNVSSGDAGDTTSTDAVFNNVTSQVSANTAYGIPSVVLQHDIKDFSVNAEERIIQWGLENGYSFRKITPASYIAHHHVNN